MNERTSSLRRHRLITLESIVFSIPEDSPRRSARRLSSLRVRVRVRLLRWPVSSALIRLRLRSFVSTICSRGDDDDAGGDADLDRRDGDDDDDGDADRLWRSDREIFVDWTTNDRRSAVHLR